MKKEVKIGEWLKEGFEAVKADVIGYAFPALILFGVCITIVGTLIAAPLICGFYNIIFKRMKGQGSSTGDLLKGFDVFLDAFLAGIIFMALIFVVSRIPVLGLILSFLIGAAFIFVLPLIWEKRFSFIEAIRESFRLFKENWTQLLLFYFVGSLVGSVGILLLGIGIILTFPIYLYATACLYRDWVGFDSTTTALPQ